MEKFVKVIAIFWDQRPGICLIVNFGAKIKIPLKIPYLGIFELQFKNTFVIFEIKTLKFSWLRNFLPEWKFPQMPYLGVLSSNFEKLLSYFKSMLSKVIT